MLWVNTEGLSSRTQVNKFNLLINYIEFSIYEYISEFGSYEEAIKTMESVYVKLKYVILAQHVLSTWEQKPVETLDKYLNELKTLAKDRDFKEGSSEQCKSEIILDDS